MKKKIGNKKRIDKEGQDMVLSGSLKKLTLFCSYIIGIIKAQFFNPL